MLRPLDYILDYEGNFWIISFYQNYTIYGKKVYVPDKNGERYHPVLKQRYKKEVSGYLPIPAKFIEAFYPIECFKNKKDSLSGVWKRYVEGLNQIGIPDQNIGIFGSILIGFDLKKDVDFVIYGQENLHLYAQNANFIKAYTNTNFISKEHIDYQLNKYGSRYNKNTDLKTILERNWSGIQLQSGVLSTPRFILEDHYEIPCRDGEDKMITCKVLSGLSSAYMPRFVNVLYQDEEYKLITPFWMFQSFAKDNDKLLIAGNVNEKNKTILLSNKNDYLKFVN